MECDGDFSQPSRSGACENVDRGINVLNLCLHMIERTHKRLYIFMYEVDLLSASSRNRSPFIYIYVYVLL